MGIRWQEAISSDTPGPWQAFLVNSFHSYTGPLWQCAEFFAGDFSTKLVLILGAKFLSSHFGGLGEHREGTSTLQSLVPSMSGGARGLTLSIGK